MTNKSTIRSAGPSFELLRTRAESDGNGGVVIKWPVVFKLLMALIPLLLATGVSMVWKVSRQQEILNERLTNFMATANHEHQEHAGFASETELRDLRDRVRQLEALHLKVGN